MIFDVTATLAGVDEPVTARSSARDILAWESDTGDSFISGETTYSQIVSLAWRACKRTGGTKFGFDEFVDALVNLESEAVDVNPTKRARSGKRSRSS